MKLSTNQSVALGDRDKRNTCWLIGCVALYQTHERLEEGVAEEGWDRVPPANVSFGNAMDK